MAYLFMAIKNDGMQKKVDQINLLFPKKLNFGN